MTEMQLGPIPTTTGCGTATSTDGSKWALLQVITPAGVQTFFLSPEQAQHLSAQLNEAASQISHSLIVPTMGEMDALIDLGVDRLRD